MERRLEMNEINENMMLNVGAGEMTRGLCKVKGVA